MDIQSDIRISAISKKGTSGLFLKLFGPLFDRILGVRKLRLLYEQNKLQGLEKYAFIEKLIKIKNIQYHVDSNELHYIPKTGAVIIVANHPLGGLEGILLALILREARPDYKLFVNIMLYFIKEIADFFIFTNPMKLGSKENFKSISQGRSWLKEGHCLMVFPAGRVGLYREEKGYITDEAWDQFALSIGLMTQATFTPIFVGGQCSRFFSWLCRLFFPAKLLLLVREFLHSFSTPIEFTIGRGISPHILASMSRKKANAYLRMRTYLLSPLQQKNCEEIFFENNRTNTKNDQLETIQVLPESGENPYSEKTQTLIIEALTKPHTCKGANRKKKLIPNATLNTANFQQFPYRLHKEVEEYIDRYGLSSPELTEIIAALEGSNKGLPPQLEQLMQQGVTFISAGIERKNSIPVLLFKNQREIKGDLEKTCQFLEVP